MPLPLASTTSSSSDMTLQDSEPPTATETTPLLVSKTSIPGGEVDPSSPLLEDGVAQVKKKASKPLPTVQLFLLCFVRAFEPIAFFAIFPFIAQMVKRNGNLPDSDVGFYSGLIESLFSVMQMIVLIFWGRLADAVGRKPILIWTSAGMAAATVFFTLATSIWEMILFRCIAGVFSGSSLVIRTMVSDLCTSETQAVAFSWFAFAGNVGIFIGPILGGALADPVNQYPSLFKGFDFLERYPYALPGFVIGFIYFVGLAISVFLLEETLKPESSSSSSSPSSPPPQQLSTLELIKAPGVAPVLWVYNHVMFLGFAFTAILPIVLFTPISLGGVEFSPLGISVWMAIQGASQALWLILAFPFLQRRWGTKGVMQACAIAYPMFFAGYIVMSTLLRIGTESAVARFWILGFIVAFIGPGVSMAFTGVQLALNDVSPSPHVLGTLNALAMTAASAIRSFVPGVATAVYAIGVRNQILWGHLAWFILIPIAMGLTICVQWLPDDKKPSKDDD